jgi:hypothetical protein
MALVSAVLGTCARALGTDEPICVGMSASLFFMLEAHDPQGTDSLRWHLLAQVRLVSPSS